MFPKILHLTCKNKNKIDNKVWIKCYEKFFIVMKVSIKLLLNILVFKILFLKKL